MARVEVVMPQMGESIVEGTIVEWLKKVGDRVEAGEPIVEIETAKSALEVESPASGTLTEIKVQVDDEVEVGAEIAIITVG